MYMRSGMGHLKSGRGGKSGGARGAEELARGNAHDGSGSLGPATEDGVAHGLEHFLGVAHGESSIELGIDDGDEGCPVGAEVEGGRGGVGHGRGATRTDGEGMAMVRIGEEKGRFGGFGDEKVGTEERGDGESHGENGGLGKQWMDYWSGLGKRASRWKRLGLLS